MTAAPPAASASPSRPALPAPPKGFDLRRLALYMLGVLGLLLLAGVASNAEQFDTSPTGSAGSGARAILPIERDTLDTTDVTPEDQPGEPIELPNWVTYVLAGGLGLGALYLLSRQRISLRLSRPSVKFSRTDAVEVTEEEEAEAIADFARDLIEELNAGDSPRYAIQRAYAAVETGFGAQELARKPAETPLRYLDRIFGRHKTVKDPLQQLTALFQRARYSDEPVTEPMRGEAIEALTQIRDYYQNYAWEKIEKKRARRAA